MRGLPKFPKEYFLKFKTTPVAIKPFDPKAKEAAQKYIARLENVLKGLNTNIIHRGSTAFGIAGKGDIEIGVYPDAQDWSATIERLKKHYGKIGNLEENYVRFNDELKGFEIEVILLKGCDAKVDQALTKYLLAHPALLKKYEEMKKKYSYSRRDYQTQKDKFLRKVVSKIPKDYI